MIPRLVVLTDRAQLRLGRGLVRTIRECADAGLTAVVVREHDLAPSARSALVDELASIPGLTVISSRVPVPRAHGLHCAGHQAAPSAGRWGRSCHSRAEVDRAVEEGASWVTLSPYAVSASKPGHGPALPPDAFAGHRVPVLALAGIDAGKPASARAAGADGVAVMGAVMRAADPAAVVAALLEELT